MKPCEEIAKRHLEHRGFTNVEPVEDDPPDLLIEGRIAVEVRRLNENCETEVGTEGHEQEQRRLYRKINGLAASFGAAPDGRSWHLFFDFYRPVEPWKTLGPKIRALLRDFRQNPGQTDAILTLGGGFKLDLMRADGPHPTFYVMGAPNDFDSGGFIEANLEYNIRICSDEKVRKIARVKNNYSEWWLALIDTIGRGRAGLDRAELRRTAPSIDNWSKIILVDPLDHTRAVEI